MYSFQLGGSFTIIPHTCNASGTSTFKSLSLGLGLVNYGLDP